MDIANRRSKIKSNVFKRNRLNLKKHYKGLRIATVFSKSFWSFRLHLACLVLYVRSELGRNGNSQRFQKVLFVPFMKIMQVKFQSYG